MKHATIERSLFCVYCNLAFSIVEMKEAKVTPDGWFHEGCIVKQILREEGRGTPNRYSKEVIA